MYIDTDNREGFEGFDQSSKALVRELLADAPTAGEPVALGQLQDLYSQAPSQDRVYLVTDGTLECHYQDQCLFHYDEGDLVGLLTHYRVMPTRIATATYAELQPYSLAQLKAHWAQSESLSHLWERHLLSLSARLAILLPALQQERPKAALGYTRYASGDVLIRQGDPAGEIYALMKGQADVFVDDVKVGEVLEEEVFGAMATLTGQPRTATVVARAPCTLVVVPRENFMSLMKTHPQLGMSLMENMARRITHLNQQVAKLRPEAAQSQQEVIQAR